MLDNKVRRMKKRLSRQEKKFYQELDLSGVAIEDVYGTRKSSPLFICLSKALIIFMVCTGTVTGFCDAFSFTYNKNAVVLFTLVVSVLISLLYANKKIFYVGYILFLVVFTVELLRYYLYANSGFQAITNSIREAYADYFNMSYVRSAEEQMTNRYVTVTITLFFIISFLIIMYNITVSRYMNFAETFAISFILLEIPLYIGLKPPLLPLILVMAGCICTGLLQKGSFNRVTIPGKVYPDYIKDKFFKRTYYTTRGSHKGILLAIAFSLVFSLVVCVISLPVFNRDLGETPEDSAKAAFDDYVKIVVQNGFWGLFNRYDSINGLNRGQLGGVSSVSPDFGTDLVVNFVPYSRETVYLPGFSGVSYTGSSWQSDVSSLDLPELNIDTENIKMFDRSIFSSMENSIRYNTIMTGSGVAMAQVTYLDKSFGMDVFPYYTMAGNYSVQKDPLYKPESQDENIITTHDVRFYAPEYVEYWMDHPGGSFRYRLSSGVIIEFSDVYNGDYTEPIMKMQRPASDELYGIYPVGGVFLKYSDYVYNICLKVPDQLDRYLSDFCRKHKNFGLKDLDRYKLLVKERLENLEIHNTYSGNSGQLFINYDSDGTDENTHDMGITDITGTLSSEELEALLNVIDNKNDEQKKEINEFRLRACEAIKNMFLDEYPYTLSPGRTPNNTDFVYYFLEEQKRGFCSHFASAAVMILRHMGIPAKYVEGYCIPYSLMSESAKKLDIDGNEWFTYQENAYNPDNNVYQVKVSDYYAHAWVEVYLEGEGFVPFEFTPPSYEAAPTPQQMTGIGGFFARLFDVDLGLGNNDTGESFSVTGDDGYTIEKEKSELNLSLLLIPLGIVTGAVALFWALFILIRRALREHRYGKWLKEGKYEPLVYARYMDFVKKLKKKKIVKEENPLPLELCGTLADYKAQVSIKTGQAEDIAKKREELYNGYLEIFEYAEKVLYSGQGSGKEEYEAYYGFIRQFFKNYK